MGKKYKHIIHIAIIGTLLTGCNGDDYKEAIAYKELGDYSSAASIFEELSDYKDSSEQLLICNDLLETIDAFNRAKINVENLNKELNEAVSKSTNLITSEKIALDDSLLPKLETIIDEVETAKYDIPEMLKTKEDITQQIAELNVVNYEDILIDLNDAYIECEKSIAQYALVDNPTEDYIISCLSKVNTIVDVDAVTEDNDPNGNLNKAGGYTSTVYFSSDLVDQSKVNGSTIIDKGTNAGGGIEVYRTPEDAQNRNKYLASFDGGMFASGSHTVIGTVLVRTSDELTASKQQMLESAIIEQLFSNEDSEPNIVEESSDAFENIEIIDVNADEFLFKLPKDWMIGESGTSPDGDFDYEYYAPSDNSFILMHSIYKKVDYADVQAYTNYVSGNGIDNYQLVNVSDDEGVIYYTMDEMEVYEYVYLTNSFVHSLGFVFEKGQSGNYEDVVNAILKRVEITNINDIKENDDLISGMRPEIKKAIDDYEIFFNEYVVFMNKYNSSSDTTALMQDYLTFVSKFATTMESMTAMENSDLTDVELKYYTEAMLRINQNLLSVVS